MTYPLPPSNSNGTDGGGGGKDQVRSTMSTTIPRLKLSLKLKPVEDEEECASVKLVSDENIRNNLPKITLSVRRTTENNKSETETKNIVNNDSFDAPITVDLPKKRRGRPPKNSSSLKVEISDPSTRRQLPMQSHVPNKHHHLHHRSALSMSTAPKPLLPAKAVNSLNLFDANGHSGNGSTSQRTGPKGPITAYTAIGDVELAKISRLKGHLSTLVDADVEAINHADYSRPFASKQDMIDRLLPFHLLSMAALQVTIVNQQTAVNFDAEMNKIRSTFQSFIQEENQRAVSTELNLLEQRLCLEEEKFLLEKMRSEYKRRISGKE